MATYITNERVYSDVSVSQRTITVNGVVLPACDEGMSIKLSDLDSTGVRSWKTGVLKRNRIRANVMSIDNMAWSNISVAAAKSILDAVSPSSVSVTAYDPSKGTLVTKKMYRSADVSYHEKRTVNGMTATVSFSLIEL